MVIAITEEPLSLAACVAAVEAPDCGAIVTFLGTVRDHSDGRATDHLEYEAYPEMAEDVLRTIVDEARERWHIGRVAVVHRIGRLDIGEPSVVIAVASPHRAEAFAACRYVIERLKQIVPIWKKEFGEGGETWVGGPTAAVSEAVEI